MVKLPAVPEQLPLTLPVRGPENPAGADTTPASLIVNLSIPDPFELLLNFND